MPEHRDVMVITRSERKGPEENKNKNKIYYEIEKTKKQKNRMIMERWNGQAINVEVNNQKTFQKENLANLGKRKNEKL